MLDRAAIEGPLRALAGELGRSPEEAAEGVIEVVNTSMEGALRVITVERGHDPVDFTLVAFGGAAGLHAVELAVRLGIPRILLPRDPGLLSAYGMLVSPIRKDAARTVLIRADSAEAELLGTAFQELEAAICEELHKDGVAATDVMLSRAIDARYRGQSFELRVPAENWVSAFHSAHEHRYGYAQRSAVVEAVTLRVVGVAVAPDVPQPSVRSARSAPQPDRTLQVGWNGQTLAAQQFARDRLRAGQRIIGPAVLVEYSSTGWIPPGWLARVHRSGHLVFERVGPARGKPKRGTRTTEREEV
ncbi:MAG TPA: hydantoinase/oxoprolinase family protein, partial [Longimicrobiales bacterium]|nr:hydantoinase/oxoprolinase family protein [Longimicrobiales bacterium]